MAKMDWTANTLSLVALLVAGVSVYLAHASARESNELSSGANSLTSLSIKQNDEIAWAERQSALDLALLAAKFDLLLQFSVLSLEDKKTFLANVEKFDEVPADILSRMNRIVTQEEKSETAAVINEISGIDIKGVVDDLTSSDRPQRVEGRENLTKFLTRCADLACGKLFDSMLSDETALSSSVYRLNLGALIAIASQDEPTSFDGNVAESIKGKLQNLAGSTDPTLRAAAERALKKVK